MGDSQPTFQGLFRGASARCNDSLDQIQQYTANRQRDSSRGAWPGSERPYLPDLVATLRRCRNEPHRRYCARHFPPIDPTIAPPALRRYEWKSNLLDSRPSWQEAANPQPNHADQKECLPVRLAPSEAPFRSNPPDPRWGRSAGWFLPNRPPDGRLDCWS